MPQYFMSIFLLPKWVRHKIDQTRRTFLWHGHKNIQAGGRGLYMVNWLLTTRPRNIGGLGIPDIQKMNQALLSKWMWQWYDISRPWWKEATPMIHECDKPWDSPNASSFWKDIATIAPAFSASVRHQIGNGKNTQFWQDNWLTKPLKFLFPNLYSMVTNHRYSSVNQYASNIDWLTQQPEGNHAGHEEKQELLAQLQQFQTNQQEEDKLIWLRSGTSYTVGSIYRFLSHSPSPTSDLKNIWKIKAPLRILVFAWLMLCNRLTTIDNLTRRGWYLPNMCTMCRESEETVAHLFQNCSMTRDIRNYMLSTFSVQFSMPPAFVTTESISMLTDPKGPTAAKQWELTTCFIIWRERCRRIFSDKVSDHIQLVREIKMEHKSWFA